MGVLCTTWHEQRSPKRAQSWAGAAANDNLSLVLLFVLSWMCRGDTAPLFPWLSLQLEGWHVQERENPRGLGQALVMPPCSLPPLQSAIPFLIVVVVLDSNLYVTYVVAVAAGISVAAAFLLPW